MVCELQRNTPCLASQQLSGPGRSEAAPSLSFRIADREDHLPGWPQRLSEMMCLKALCKLLNSLENLVNICILKSYLPIRMKVLVSY